MWTMFSTFDKDQISIEMTIAIGTARLVTSGTFTTVMVVMMTMPMARHLLGLSC